MVYKKGTKWVKLLRDLPKHNQVTGCSYSHYPRQQNVQPFKATEYSVS